MKNWNSLTKNERIFAWAEFRDYINDASDDEKIHSIAKFFKYVPIATRQVDYYTPADWPTPWEILHDGQCCPSSISLLMAYTLQLVGIDDFKLLLIDDSSDLYMILHIHSKYILNYALGEVLLFETIEDEIEIKQAYDVTDLKDIY